MDNTSNKKERFFEYIEEKWKEVLDCIEGLKEGEFRFAVQSDTHYSILNSGKTANNIKALSHFVPMSFYANFGDYIKGYYMGDAGKHDNTPELTMASLKELTSRYLDGANCPVLVTMGNHDTNQLWCKHYGRADQQLTKADHYEQVFSKLKLHNGEAMVSDGESNYYYVDFPSDDIRVIMLNTTDGNYECEFDSTAVIGERQLEWFKNVALDTDMNVIVVCHVPFIKEFPGNDSSVIKNGDRVREAVEKFIENGGKFTVYMCGHTHNQADLIDENGRLHISFKNGGGYAELVTFNVKARVITTNGLGKLENRKYTY